MADDDLEETIKRMINVDSWCFLKSHLNKMHQKIGTGDDVVGNYYHDGDGDDGDGDDGDGDDGDYHHDGDGDDGDDGDRHLDGDHFYDHDGGTLSKT